MQSCKFISLIFFFLHLYITNLLGANPYNWLLSCTSLICIKAIEFIVFPTCNFLPVELKHVLFWCFPWKEMASRTVDWVSHTLGSHSRQLPCLPTQPFRHSVLPTCLQNPVSIHAHPLQSKLLSLCCCHGLPSSLALLWCPHSGRINLF